MQANPTDNYRDILNKFGTLFGLVLVISLFATLLALKDFSEARGKNVSRQQLTASTGSWCETGRSCSFEGLQAFIGVANVKTVLAQTVIVAVGALGMTMI